MKKVTYGVVVKVKVLPNSSKNHLIEYKNDELKVKIKAVPEKGKANAELIHFLSKELKIPKSSIKILKGESSANKILLFSLEEAKWIDILKNYLMQNSPDAKF